MPPKKTNPDMQQSTTNSSVALSAREQTLLSCAMQSLENEPKLNFIKFAELAGFNNPKSGNNAWGALKKKIGLAAPAGANGGSSAPSTPNAAEKQGRTPRSGRKRKGDEDADGDGDSADTPVKKQRTSKVKPEVKEEEDVDGASDDN